MKVCPYCKKEIGNTIYGKGYELFDEDEYENKMRYIDYIVTCPHCDGGFHWIETFQRIKTRIENADTGEWTEYKESE